MKYVKQQNIFVWITVAAAVLALISMIIYIVTGTTGFMSGTILNALPIVFTILAIAVLVASVLLSAKLDKRIVGVMLAVACVLLAVSFCIFIVERIQIFADVWFIPVNYPEAEGAALSSSVTGIVFYILSVVCVIVAGFAEKLNKE